jgi:thiamine biosynthesis lipoprotein
MSDHRFRAMGVDVIVGAGTLVERRRIENLFRERDRVFSRFVQDSEINRVNDRAGHLVSVSDLFAATLRVAIQVERETGGLVAPSLGADVEGAGYSRDFDQLAPSPLPPVLPRPHRSDHIMTIGNRVRIPPDVKLDLNGVVKAMAVDDALALLGGDGFVSAGGDLAARGELTVAMPDGCAVALRQGAIATSGTTRRRWLRAGEVQHHLIDPRTHTPSTSAWTEVSACGATCLSADVAAKAGFLLGEAGPAWLDARGIPARFLTAEGSVSVNDTWARMMQGSEPLSCT